MGIDRKLALIGFVAYALISAVSNVGLDTIVEEFQSADKAWLLAAIVLTPLAQVPQAFSTIGASTYPLRFFPSLMLQYGIQFISLAVPSSAARVALEIRFFERIGAPAAGAVTVGMIDSFSTFCIQILLMARHHAVRSGVAPSVRVRLVRILVGVEHRLADGRSSRVASCCWRLPPPCSCHDSVT